MKEPTEMSGDDVSQFVKAYEEFLSGNPTAFVQLLSVKVAYHLPGKHLGGGILRGREVMLNRARSAALACDTLPICQLLSAASGGNFVVTIERATFRRIGRVLDQQVCAVWRFSEGQCVEIWSHFDDQGLCDSFWEGWRPEQ